MKTAALLLLVFLLGMMVPVGCWGPNEAGKVKAQAGAGGWEHKFFLLETESAGFPATDTLNTKLADINAGGWEYSGFWVGGNEHFKYALFRRAKK